MSVVGATTIATVIVTCAAWLPLGTEVGVVGRPGGHGSGDGRNVPRPLRRVGVHSGIAYGLPETSQRRSPPWVWAATPAPGAPLPLIVFDGECDTTVAPVNAENLVAAQLVTAQTSVSDTTRTSTSRALGTLAPATCTQTSAASCWWSTGERTELGTQVRRSPVGSHTDPMGPDA